MEGDTVGVVRDLARGGDAVCETAHGLVFARGGLPGEQVILRNVQKRGKIARGRIVKVTEPSAHRVSSPCEWSDAVVVVPIHASRALQSERKVGFLRDAITRQGTRTPASSGFPLL